MRLRLVLVWLIVAGSISAQAQGQADRNESDSDPAASTQNASVDAGLLSPRETMRTFVEAMARALRGDDSGWERALDTMSFDGADFDRDHERARPAAAAIREALDHIREINYDDLPNAGQVQRRVSYLYFPQATQEDRERHRVAQLDSSETIRITQGEDGAWRFDPRTVNDAQIMAAKLSVLERVTGTSNELVTGETTDSAASLDGQNRPEGAAGAAVYNAVDSVLPEAVVGRSFLGIRVWQWIGILVVIFLGTLLDLTIRLGLRAMVSNLIRAQKVSPERGKIADTLRPIGLFAAGIVWVLLLPLLELPVLPANILTTSAKLFASFFGIVALTRIITLVADVAESRADQTTNKFDDVLIPLIRKSAKIFVTVMGVLYAADALSIDIWPLLASLGLTSVAIAFAAKDTVENFFGSVAVLLDRPFHVGDWVVIDDTEGTVESVGFRSTRVRTFYNSQVTVPNANLVRAVVDNYGRRKYRRWRTTLGVTYDTSPENLIAFTEGIRELVRAHPYTRKDYFQVWVNEFSTSSIDVLIYIFHEVPDWSTELRERERLMVDIVRLADALGVQFAFPTQTIHLQNANEPAPAPERQHTPPRSMTDRRAQVTGIRKAQEVTAQQHYIREQPGPVVFPEGPTKLGDERSIYEVTEDTRSEPEPEVSEVEAQVESEGAAETSTGTATDAAPDNQGPSVTTDTTDPPPSS